ncbi:hypothetical protein Y032_0019g3751 [Ancylostoma ceylanicum]|uniref:Uncharacterized protein n=1 Tax=Ancylostoma ceylanicum TaxID=53326 RepID=A0A016V1H3_9BILA|nr:hypothetical protein Y032_0019g3751 [Ancylostoma ceylanicum]
MSLRESGKRDAANIVGEVAAAPPGRATNLKKAGKREESETNAPKAMSADAALARYWQTKMWTEKKVVSKFYSMEDISNFGLLGFAAEFAWCENSKKLKKVASIQYNVKFCKRKNKIK